MIRARHLVRNAKTYLLKSRYSHFEQNTIIHKKCTKREMCLLEFSTDHIMHRTENLNIYSWSHCGCFKDRSNSWFCRSSIFSSTTVKHFIKPKDFYLFDVETNLKLTKLTNVYEPGTYKAKQTCVYRTLKEYTIHIWEVSSEFLSARIDIHFNAHEKSTVTLIHTQSARQKKNNQHFNEN